MIEAVVAILAVVVAFLFGRRKGKQDQKVKGYDRTKARIDAVERADDSTVVDRLREHL